MSNYMKKYFIQCDCDELRHTMQFMWDPEEPDLLYIYLFASPYMNWWQRIIAAIKFVFMKRRSIVFEDYIWTTQEAEQVMNTMVEYSEDYHKFKEKWGDKYD